VRFPLAIGAALILMITGGWIAGDVDFAIYPLLGAPIAGFIAGAYLMNPPRELPVFYATAGVAALCLALWAAARNDLRRTPEPGPRSRGPAELQPR
jgi:hypothetical protein